LEEHVSRSQTTIGPDSETTRDGVRLRPLGTA
jgi:hypothetical protein